MHSEVRVTGRSQVTFELAAGTGSRTFRLSAAEGGLAVRHDPRILNFRVFRCRWRKGCGRDESSQAEAGALAPTGTDRVEPEWKGRSKPRAAAWRIPSLTRKVIGVLRRAGHSGPVITVWVPVPSLVRRILRLCLAPPLPMEQLSAPTKTEPNEPPVISGCPVCEPGYLHTNACGDFTLIARERWFDLRGYPEWDMYSFHIDSVLCYAAHHGGTGQVLLKEPMRIYHIEHGHGSGWTPEGHEQLFRRLKEQGVPWLAYEHLMEFVAGMRRLDCPMIFNRANWGLADHDLPESTL